MADTKKFLDQAGVEYLWSKVNMQDYPNNQTLMAVIDAIDKTKSNEGHTHSYNELTDLPSNIGGGGASYDDTELRNLIDTKADKDDLFSGDYNDLTNRPTIPLTSVLASKTYVDEKIEAVDAKFDGIKIKRVTQEQYDALRVKGYVDGELVTVIVPLDVDVADGDKTYLLTVMMGKKEDNENDDLV